MMERSKLICHIIYRLAVGGLENGLVNLVNHLPADRYRHCIVCLTEATGFAQRIERRDVEVYEVHKLLGKDIRAYGRVRQLLRSLKPDIVHTRNLPAVDMLLPAALAHVPRLVHGEHGRDLIELDGKNTKYNLLRRLSRLVVHQYVAVSEDLAAWLRTEIGIPASRVQRIYNGVDTRRFSPEGRTRSVLPDGFALPGTFVIGTFGRIDGLKNQLGLARAFLRLMGARPELRGVLRLVIIGDGPQRAEIEKALASAGMLEFCWLPGFRDDTPALYRALDLFILPSLREGISNTVLEAMASGLPVIANRVGGNPEILPNNVAGRLVATSEDELIEAISAYVSSPELLCRHGRGARAHVATNFSLDKMVESYDRLYWGLLHDVRTMN
jgi:sugar transferase (PEP-CTERM/EpsH1 system associated)